MRVLQKGLLLLCITSLVGVGVITVGLIHAPTAHAAAYCYNTNCKNLDPTLTYSSSSQYYGVRCDQGAQQQGGNVNGTGGYVQNWYSYACDANFTVAQPSSGYWPPVVEQWLCPPASVSLDGLNCNITPLYYADTAGGTWSSAFCSSSFYVHNCGDIPNWAPRWFTNMVPGSYAVKSVACFSSGGTSCNWDLNSHYY